MDDDWETAADNDLVLRPKTIGDNNKWAGEDDDENVKDSWEDEEEKKDEEKVDTTASAASAIPAKVKSSKSGKVKFSEDSERKNENESTTSENLSPEEKLANKLRVEKEQQESDLKSALETLGVSSIPGRLDGFDPKSKEDFKEFGSALSWKLLQYDSSPHYVQFIEDLFREVCVKMPTSDLKRMKWSIDAIFAERQKIEKQNSKKSVGAKGKVKITLRTENDEIESYQKYVNDFDDYDDFM